MRDLINKVEVAGGDAATALRVIAHFDSLIESGASRDAILRAAAALAGTSAGYLDTSSNASMRVDASGRPIPGSLPPEKADYLTVDPVRATAVWLERQDAPGPLDQLILERCAQALRVRLRPPASPRTTEEVARAACDPQTPPSERAASLRALRLPTNPVVVLTDGDVPPIVEARTKFEDCWVGLLPDRARAHAAIPDGVRAGSADTIGGDVFDAIQRAHRALSLAILPVFGGPSFVIYEEMGPLVPISDQVSAEAAATTPEIVTLEALRARRAWVPQIYYQLAVGASLRHAAKTLHVHHSTLQDRLDWLETQTGHSLRSPDGRLRASTTWILWRISGLLGAPDRLGPTKSSRVERSHLAPFNPN